jgi:uncharacterized membrane protein YcaP (DUF421 family)
MREADIFDLSEVQCAIVENTGKINFYKKSDAAGAKQCDPQTAVIKDGKIDKYGLAQSGQSLSWVRGILNQKRLSEKDVFLMTADSVGGYNLVEKSK